MDSSIIKKFILYSTGREKIIVYSYTEIHIKFCIYPDVIIYKNTGVKSFEICGSKRFITARFIQ